MEPLFYSPFDGTTDSAALWRHCKTWWTCGTCHTCLHSYLPPSGGSLPAITTSNTHHACLHSYLPPKDGVLPTCIKMYISDMWEWTLYIFCPCQLGMLLLPHKVTTACSTDRDGKHTVLILTCLAHLHACAVKQLHVQSLIQILMNLWKEEHSSATLITLCTLQFTFQLHNQTKGT